MRQFPAPHAAQVWCRAQRQQGLRLGFVPTMGALHAGHESLVKKSAAENDVTCASIFINPLQFDDAADFAAYPKTYAEDVERLTQWRCDMVFTGKLADFFPGQTQDDIPRECPSEFARGLEGEYRAQHLHGVWAIVEKLFDTLGDCRAYFGEKDFQQCLLVKDLAMRLRARGLMIDVAVCPTVRDADGLAVSSRNRRLNPAARKRAVMIYQTLLRAKELWQQGERDAARLEAAMQTELLDAGLTPQYAAIRDPLAWSETTSAHALQHAQALIACEVDGVRLIDNLRLG